MARNRAIAPLKKKNITPEKNKHTTSGREALTPRYNTRRSTQGTVAQSPVYAEAESSDDEEHHPVSAKRKAKMRIQPEQGSLDQGPPAPRYNTRYKKVRLSELSQDALSDADDVEEISREEHYPLYKDDLPNAFNGAVDPSLDSFSKMPNEVIDIVLSLLVLDHDPDFGVKVKEGTYKPIPHVLLSMAAMSRLFYHATEDFARRYRAKNPRKATVDWSVHPWMIAKLKADEEKERNKRRSARIAEIAKPETHEFHRKTLLMALRSQCAICNMTGWRPGKLANKVSICEDCERSAFGKLMNLTDALKQFDLRDYMLIKSRKPGPRAKFLDLPSIPYGSEHKPVGFPVFNTVTIFYFRRSDVEMLAKLVHGDVDKHLQQKEAEREVRRMKVRRKRIREFKTKHHRELVEVSTGAVARRHAKEMKRLLDLDPDDDEDDYFTEFGCRGDFCYHDIGLCDECGDVPGYSHEWCGECADLWVERRLEKYYNR